MALIMKPLFGIDCGNILTKEFAKSRGAIHFHSTLTVSEKYKEKYHKAYHDSLYELSLGVHNALVVVNNFITENYNREIHAAQFPVAPNLIYSKDKGLVVRKEFCHHIDGGNEIWETFECQFEQLKKIAKRPLAVYLRDIGDTMQCIMGLYQMIG